jgi:hypothetical protein
MSKPPRRLWLGDWQRNRDEEPAPAPQVSDPDQDDTFVIMPAEEGHEEPAHPRRNVRRLAGVALLGLLAVLAFVVSSGGKDKPVVAAQPTVPQAQTPQTQIPPAQQLPQLPQVPQGAPQQGFGGADLTGPAAVKAARAALARYPGSVERVTAGSGGRGYVVHVIQGDGNEVHVAVDGQFKVQGSDAGAAPPSAGFGTPQ